MKSNEIITENADGWTIVRKWLGKLYGFGSRLPSKLKRIKQTFDESTGEHVIYLEYRVRAPHQQAIPRVSKPKLLPDKKAK
jgi:hypothetical protein